MRRAGRGANLSLVARRPARAAARPSAAAAAPPRPAEPAGPGRAADRVLRLPGEPDPGRALRRAPAPGRVSGSRCCRARHPARSSRRRCEQGLVDLVVDYSRQPARLPRRQRGRDARDAGARCRAALRTGCPRAGSRSLGYAPAEDANAFAVRTAFARQHGLTGSATCARWPARLTLRRPAGVPAAPLLPAGPAGDVRPAASRSFRPQPTREATATALETRRDRRGLLETTYGPAAGRPGHAARRRPRPAAAGEPRAGGPDRGRQPVRHRLAAALDGLSARLDTADLIGLNHIAAVDPEELAEAVAAYLRLFAGRTVCILRRRPPQSAPRPPQSSPPDRRQVFFFSFRQPPARLLAMICLNIAVSAARVDGLALADGDGARGLVVVAGGDDALRVRDDARRRTGTR